MASSRHKAVRQESALRGMADLKHEIAEKLGITVAEMGERPPRDADLRRIVQIEEMVSFLKSVNEVLNGAIDISMETAEGLIAAEETKSKSGKKKSNN
jgi:hypothetical protein